jgi:hypothetical protein
MHDKTAFQSETERQLLRMSADMLRLLNRAQDVDADGRMLGPMIDEMCDRWTDAERVRNLMRVRMSTGGEPRDLQDDLRAAIRDLRLSMDDVAAGCTVATDCAGYLAGADPEARRSVRIAAVVDRRRVGGQATGLG